MNSTFQSYEDKLDYLIESHQKVNKNQISIIKKINKEVEEERGEGEREEEEGEEGEEAAGTAAAATTTAAAAAAVGCGPGSRRTDARSLVRCQAAAGQQWQVDATNSAGDCQGRSRSGEARRRQVRWGLGQHRQERRGWKPSRRATEIGGGGATAETAAAAAAAKTSTAAEAAATKTAATTATTI